MPVEAIAGKILSEHGELTAVVTILHDRREAIEKARLYEQLKQASDELERKVQAATAELARAERAAAPAGDRARAGLARSSRSSSPTCRTSSGRRSTRSSATRTCCCRASPGQLDRPVKRQLERIDSNGRHLLTIINEILDITRIEAGRMPLQISTFNVDELVAEVQAELEPIIMRSKLAVTPTLPRSCRRSSATARR